MHRNAHVKTKAPDVIMSQENRLKDFLNKCVCQKKIGNQHEFDPPLSYSDLNSNFFLSRKQLVICFLCEDAVHQTVYHKGNVNFGKFSLQILLTHRVIATLLLNGRCLLRRLMI